MDRLLVTAALLIGLATPVVAAETCLSRAEQRAAIAKGQAVPLGAAMRAVKGARGVRGLARAEAGREVVNAELCRRGNNLVYVLTVLAPDGKVSRAMVDAGSGRVIDGR